MSMSDSTASDLPQTSESTIFWTVVTRLWPPSPRDRYVYGLEDPIPVIELCYFLMTPTTETTSMLNGETPRK